MDAQLRQFASQLQASQKKIQYSESSLQKYDFQIKNKVGQYEQNINHLQQ